LCAPRFHKHDKVMTTFQIPSWLDDHRGPQKLHEQVSSIRGTRTHTRDQGLLLKKVEILAMLLVFTFFRFSTPWDVLGAFLFLLAVEVSLTATFALVDGGTAAFDIISSFFDSTYLLRVVKLIKFKKPSWKSIGFHHLLVTVDECIAYFSGEIFPYEITTCAEPTNWVDFKSVKGQIYYHPRFKRHSWPSSMRQSLARFLVTVRKASNAVLFSRCITFARRYPMVFEKEYR